MDALEVLRSFDAEMRAEPPPETGVARAWFNGVLRTEGAYNLIGWWEFEAGRAEEIARREAAFFGARPVEWKVYSHDRPPLLERALAGAGFEPGEAETFLVLDLAATPALRSSPGLEVRHVRDAGGAADLAAVSRAAFGRDESARLASLLARLEDPDQALFVAYDAGEPVASGRLELGAGRGFAGLYGGGVKPGWRGRGLYRALVAARAAHARRRACRYLTVDARETSRPILQALGFVPLATIRAWTLNGG